jgi:membrane protein
MRRAAKALVPTLRYWMQTEVHVYAFSVAANVLLSFYPFLIVIMSIWRHLFNEQFAQNAIDLALRDYFPDAFGSFLHSGKRNNLPAGGPTQVFSIILLLFTANGIFVPLEVALNRVWGIHKNRSFVRNQLVSFGLIFACGGLAFLSMMLSAMSQSFVFSKILAVPVGVLALFLVYRFLPNGRPPFARVVAASIGVGVLLEVLKYLNKLVWPWFQTKLENEYKIFQYSVALILLGFLGAMLVLAGAEWAARGHRLDEISKEEAHA